MGGGGDTPAPTPLGHCIVLCTGAQYSTVPQGGRGRGIVPPPRLRARAGAGKGGEGPGRAGKGREGP